MATKQVTLIFPQDRIKEPVIYNMARAVGVAPNIRRAKVTETVGEVTLELEGTEEQLAQGIAYLEQNGVKVQPIGGDTGA
jgi:L-aspartate semialdehyde sulfurtransferase ferredoxin